ncbi:MAG: glycoside hydrolase family 15 protein, partial [Thermoplasmata archaeon]
SVDDPEPNEGPEMGDLSLPNLPPGVPTHFPASEIVSTGFLDLVRFGVRPPTDPIVQDTLRVVDRVLRVDTPLGPLWHRYNHDGYGQRDDGGPYAGWGVGRPWPLLTGERGHYELALGHDPAPYLRAMERFATQTGLLTEQVWDAPDLPSQHLELGRPTEAAMPLAWAHAEYVTLLRSTVDGQVFDRIPEVAERYLRPRRSRRPIEVWKFNRRPRTVDPSATLRVIADQPFRLRASEDEWRTGSDVDSRETALGLWFADLPPLDVVGRAWQFTFYWTVVDRWEGRNFSVSAGGAAENELSRP